MKKSWLVTTAVVIFGVVSAMAAIAKAKATIVVEECDMIKGKCTDGGRCGKDNGKCNQHVCTYTIGKTKYDISVCACAKDCPKLADLKVAMATGAGTMTNDTTGQVLTAQQAVDVIDSMIAAEAAGTPVTVTETDSDPIATPSISATPTQTLQNTMPVFGATEAQ